MKNLTGIVEYEFKRIIAKKSFYLMVAMAFLPIIAAVAIKHYGHGAGLGPDKDYLWLYLYGTPRSIFGGGVLFSVVGLASYMWVFASLFGGDMIASDLRDNGVQLLLSKPIRRIDYVLGKTLTVVALLYIVYLIGSIVSLVSGYIAGGHQSSIILVPLLPMVLALASIPLILLSAWIGAYSGSPMTGLLSGIGLYFLSSTIAGVVGLTAGSSGMMVRMMDYGVIDPIRASTQLATLTSMYLTGIKTMDLPSPGGSVVYYGISKLFIGSWVNLAVSSVIIAYFLVKWFNRKSF